MSFVSRFLSWIFLLLVLPGWVQAQVTFAPRYTSNTKGDIVFVSNASMTCAATATFNSIPCTTARTSGANVVQSGMTNNNFPMVYIDTDSDASTFNSTSAQLNLPAGSSILFAGLYWAGDSATAARNTVQIKGPLDTAYSLRTAAVVQGITGGTVYQSFADITAYVAAQGNGNYTLANIYSTQSPNMYAGWTIVVAYQNASLPMRNITVYDGYQRVSSASAGVNINLSGFLTPPIGTVNTRLGTIAYDGDRGSTEGTAGLQFGPSATTLSPVFNSLNPQTDYFNSTITRDGAEVSTRNPAYLNTFGYDADISIPNTSLPNGATTAVARVQSSSETIDLGVVTLVNDIFVPNIKDTLTKKVTDVNGGQVLPGDILEYELSFSNIGQDPALNGVLTDKIPANTTYLPGSLVIVSGANAGAKTDAAGDDQAEYDALNKQVVFRVGVGANATTGGKISPGDPTIVLRFRVQVDAGTPGDTIIDNYGVITTKAQTLGTVSSDTSDADANTPGDQPARVIVASPDLTIAKSHSGNFFAGQTGVTYSLVISNSGLASTSGLVTVTEVPPTGLSSVVLTASAPWVCAALSCSRSDVLPPGQTYTAILVTANVDVTAPALITNTASVSGGAEGSSRTGNNTATDATTILQGFPIGKSFTPDSVGTGQTSVLKITVFNVNGTTAINNLAVNDPLPAGVVVANPAGASAVGCGTLVFSPAPNATSLSSSGGTVAPNTTCTLTVNVLANAAGAYSNTIPVGSITTTNFGNNKQVATAVLNVAAPDLKIAKSVSGNLYRGQTAGASFDVGVSNGGTGTNTGAVTVVDNLPAGLVPTSATGGGWNCSIAAQQVTCSRGDALIPSGIFPSITIVVSVDTNAPTSMTNTASVSSASEPAGNTGNNTASVPVKLLLPPSVSKSFAPAAINLGGTALLQITLTNPNALTITGMGVVDNYPTYLLNAAGISPNTTCAGGAVTGAPGSSALQLTNATLLPNASCTLSMVVTVSPSAPSGGYVNTLPAGAVTTANAGSSAQATSATLAVAAPDLTIAKTHTGTFFPGQTTATFSIVVSNNGPAGNGATLGQLTVTDNLPAGLVALSATGSGWGPGVNACSVAGQSVICNRLDSLAYGSAYPAIIVTAQVANNASGAVVNSASVSGGGEPAANSGNNSVSDTASVLSGPTVVKSFSPSAAALGVPVQMSIVIQNPNAVAMTGVGFTDTYPAGLVNAGVPTSTGCTGASAPGNSLVLSNASIAANSVCTITVQVQANTVGDLNNAIPAGGLTTANAGSNNTPANATLKAAATDLIISKTHSGNFFQGQTTAVFQITVTNQGAGTSTGKIAVTDDLPTGLIPIAAGAAAWGPQPGGRCTVAGQNVSCETSNVLAPGASLSFPLTVSVANNAPSSLVNTVKVMGGNEPLSSQNNNDANDSVLIFASPRMSKAFNPAAASANQVVTLTITVFNDNPNALTGLALSDTLPTNLLIAAGSQGNTCGGSLNAVLGSGSVALTGGAVPANSSCVITVPVAAAFAGSYLNTIPAANLTSNEAGAAQVPAQANLAVAAADLQITKSHIGSFYQGQSPVSYAINVSNIGSGSTDGSNLLVTDNLPVGLTPINVSGTGWTCGFSGQLVSCNRSGIVAPGALPVITVQASVDANAPASLVNTANVSGGGEPASSSANNTANDPTVILANPLVSKVFSPAITNINQVSVLTIRITNPNAVAITGLNFNDVYPSGLVNSSAPALNNSCSGTPSASAGGNSLALSLGSVLGNSSCEISVQVLATSAGAYSNTLPAGAVSSSNAGGNAQTASAVLNVAGPDLSVTKSHTGNFYKNQVGAQFKIVVRNIGLGATSGAVTVADTLPGTMVATAISGNGWSCGLTPLQCSRTDPLAAGAAYDDILVTVNVSNAAATTENNRVDVSGGGEPASNLSNNVATDNVLVLGNPVLAKSFTPGAVNANNPSELLLVLTNPNSVAITGVNFIDTFPSGLLLNSTPSNTCAGSLAAAPGSLALSNAIIPANASCEIRVKVSASNSGVYPNLIAAGGLNSANAGSNQNAASATLSVASPDITIAKTHAGDFYVGQNPATYSIEVRNIGAGASNGTPILVTDTLPSGLSYLGFSGSGWTCANAGQVVSCSHSAVLAVGSALPILSINVAVGVAAAPAVANTANVGGGGEPAANANNNSVTDNTKVLRNPVASKAFTPSAGNINSPVRLVVTLMNSNDVPITGVGFLDTYQGTLINANPAAAISTCAGVVTTPASNALQLSGGIIPPSSSCQVEVSVVATAPGNYTNTLAAASVVSSNAGSNASPTTAYFAAQSPDLTIVKSHGLSFYAGQTNGTFTLKVTNIGVSASTGAVTVTDVVPAGMSLVSMSGTNWTCPGAGNVCTRNAGFTSLNAGQSFEDILVTVSISPSANGSLVNQANVSNANEPTANLGNNSANDSVAILANPQLSKSFTPPNILANGVSVLKLVLSNSNLIAGSNASFSDTMPSGVTFASPANAVSTCGGTLSTLGTTLQLLGGAIPAAGNCEVRVNVTASAPGAYVNTVAAGALTTNNLGRNTQAAVATLTVASPDLILSKSHTGNVFQGQNGVTFTLVVSNIGQDASSGPIYVTDTFPAGISPISATGAGGWTCGISSGVTVACSNNVSLGAGASLPAISIIANVLSTATSVVNTAQVGGGGEASGLAGNNSASDRVDMLTPLQVSKGFSPNPATAGQITNLAITISNLNSLGGTIPVSLTDTMPSQIVVSGTPTTACLVAGSINAPIGASIIRVNAIQVPQGASCVVNVPVSSSSPGAWINQINQTDVTPNTNAPSVATLVVNAPNLSVAKSHTGTFYAGQKGAQFSITVSNVGNAPTNGTPILVTDTFPAGLTPISASGNGWICSAPVGSQIACSRSSSTVVPAGGSLSPIIVVVDVDASASGVIGNRAQVSGGGEVDVSNNDVTDNVQIVRAITMVKQFGSSAIGPNQTTTLTIRLINPNPVVVTGVGFTDTFPVSPGQMLVAGALSTNCPAGSPQAIPGNIGFNFLNGSVAANSFCTVSAVVSAAVSGLYNNAIPASALTTTNAGIAAQDTSDSITIEAPDLIIKKSAVNVPFYPGQTDAAFSLIVQNIGNATASLGLITVQDNFPTGLNPTAVSGGPSWSCQLASPSVTCSRDAAAVNLASGASYPAIIITSTVASSVDAGLTNTASVSGGGDNNSSNNTGSVTFEILRSPQVGKSFSPSSAQVSQTVQLTINLTNPNSIAVTGVNVTDTLPAGLSLTNDPSPVSTCGGSVAAAAGGSLLALSNGTIPSAGCFVRVNVWAVNPGIYTNIIPAGQLESANGGKSQQAGTASLQVSAPDLKIIKKSNSSFWRGQQVGADYNITVSNVGSTPTVGTVTMQDILPTGLTANTATGTGWSCAIAAQIVSCSRGDALAIGANYPDIRLGVSVARDAPLSLVNTAKISGGGEPPNALGNNSSDDVTTILVNPVVSKRFLPDSISLGQVTTLEIKIVNSNALAMTNVSVVDAYPPGLINAPTPNASASCGGNAIATPGLGVVSLSAANIPANSACLLKADVTTSPGLTPSALVNTILAGSVTSANAGDNLLGAIASLNISAPDLAISKTHVGNFYAGQSTAAYVVTVSNIGSGNSSGVVNVVDNLPSNMTAVAVSANGWTCNAVPTAVLNCSRTDSLVAGTSWPPIVITALISQTAGSFINTAKVSGGSEGTNTLANNTANDETLVLANPNVSKSFSSNSALTNVPVTLTLLLSNPNAAAIAGIGLTDNFPSGLTIAPGAAALNTCGGNVSASGSSVVLANGALPANASCNIAVAVLVSATGTIVTNVLPPGALSSNAGGNQQTVSASIAGAVTDPTGYKSVKLLQDADSSGGISSGDILEWTVIFANTQDGSMARPGFQITDVLPSGLSLASAPSVNVLGQSTSASINPGYNGSSQANLLAPGAVLGAGGIIRVQIPTRILPNIQGSLSNQASAIAPSLNNPIRTSAFDSTTPPSSLPPGVTVPPSSIVLTNPGTSSSTAIIVEAPARIGVSKSVNSTVQVNGTTVRVTYDVLIKNFGPGIAPNIQALDNLGLAYPAPVSFSVVTAPFIVTGSAPAVANSGFNGLSDQRLLQGTSALATDASILIRFAVNVNLVGNQTSFGNSVFASSLGGSVNSGGTVSASANATLIPEYTPAPGAASTDASNQAAPSATLAQMVTAVDPNGNRNPSDPGEDVPTRANLAYAAALRGSVWIDSTPNRRRDGSEQGVANFGVELINASTGQVVPCIANVNTNIGCVVMPDGRSLFATNAQGNYEVVGIPVGAYRIQFRDGGNNVIYGTPVNGSDNPQSSVAGSRDGLLVNLTPGDTVLDQSLPLDPSGVVYNSLPTSRAPIAGARVVFCGPDGFNPVTHLVGGSSYELVDGKPNCAAMVVGSNGFYQYLLQPGAPSGRYTLSATASGYFPSVAIPANATPPVLPPAPGVYAVQTQSIPPTGAQPTTYYLTFNLSGGVQDVVHNHIPLDPLSSARLFLTKAVNQRTAEIGDSVEYTLSVTSPDTPLSGVRVLDRLPTGFRLIPNTTRINDLRSVDPAGMPGPELNFLVGNIAQNVPARIVYRVRLGVGAQIGDGINRANASATGGVNSNVAQAVVKVTGGVFTSDGCVVGKIYVDCNRNHTQDPGEPGIPGVRFYLEDGTYLISDREGKYSYCGLGNTTHVIKVDPRTLPPGSRMTTFSNRNVGDANSVLIDMRSGELHRADFVEGSCKPEILEEIELRRGRMPILGGNSSSNVNTHAGERK